ncbi:MAG: TonB-dependent receptor [Steroidobacteraceae bacterium]
MRNHRTMVMPWRKPVAGAALLAVTAAWAQAPAPAAPGESLEEVIVTATRRAESVQDIPVSITAISGDQLAQMGVTQTRELVELAPNITSQGSFSRTAPAYFIRGIGSTQFNPNSNSKVGVYVDDTYLSSPAVHGAQVFDIDRVEIARGPQGYLFGQNTTGGLVRSITRRPVIGAGTNGNLSLTYGRFGEKDLSAALGFDMGSRAAGRIAIDSQQRDGISRNLLTGADTGATDTLAWRAQFLFAVSDSVKLSFNAHGSNDESDLVPYKQLGLVDPATGAPCAAPGLGSGCTDFFGYADTTRYHEGSWDVPNQFSKVHAGGGSMTLEWAAPSFTLTAVSAYERNHSSINEDTDVSPLDVVHGAYDAKPHQFSQEIRLASQDSAALRWIAGLYYFREVFEGGVHFAIPGFGPSFFSGVSGVPEGFGQRSHMLTRSYAAFGSLDFKLDERTKLSVGLRATHESKDVRYAAYLTNVSSVTPATFVGMFDIEPLALFQTIDFRKKRDWNNLSGRIALDYKFADDVMGYVSVARGFNSGNFNGGAFLDITEASLVNPELLKSYEVGIKSQLLGGKLRLNGDFFYYDFTDQQVFVLASGAGGLPFQQLSNAAASSLYGAELELAYRPVSALMLQAGVGLTHSKFDKFDSPLGGNLSGMQLPSAPKTNFNLLARYTVPLPGGSLSIEADTKYNSHQFFSVNNDPLLAQDAYWLANARLSYATSDDRLTVTLWGRNLGDKQYLTGAYDLAAFGFDQLVPADQRTYGLTVSIRTK